MVSKSLFSTTILLLLGLLACRSEPPSTVDTDDNIVVLQAERLLMGTRFAIRLATDATADTDEVAGTAAIEAAFEEVARIEDRTSEWRRTSEISAVNAAAGDRPVTIGPELKAVVERALHISELTRGAFDITFAACGSLWSFSRPLLPDPAAIKTCLPRVDYRRVVLDSEASTLFLPDADMQIGISGIGKGYGIDRAADVLEERGFTNYIVDGGGDLRLRGRKGEQPWVTGIAHPRRPGKLFGTLRVDHGSVVTSGDYQQYFELGSQRYHHILDPSTGWPAERSIAVTLLAPTAMDADAFATGLFVLGPEEGLALVETLPGVEALFFDKNMTPRASSGFPPWQKVD